MAAKSLTLILQVSFLFAFLSALGSVQADPVELVSPNEEVDGDFGWHLSGVPDVNGDGRGDVVVGARSDDPGGSPTDAGRAYVYDGVTGALLHTLVSPNEEDTGNFGQSVSGISDVNGDGRGDVVVGAYYEDPGGSPSDAGRAHIYDGSTGALLHTLVSPNEEVDGNFGVSVTGVSDVNGDGRGDVVVGAYFEGPGGSPSQAGRAYIFDGSTGALLHTLVSPNEGVDGRFGVWVSGVSDVNGDSRGDVVVGARLEGPGGSPSQAGRAYIFDGSTGALLHTLVSPNEELGGQFGVRVSGVSDVNGDGRGDVVIGAWQEDPGASPSEAGRAYIFDGSTGALLHTLVSPNEEPGGRFGNAVSGLSDFNGDGRGDVVVGARSDDPGTSPSNAGRAYIYDGSSGTLLQTLVSANEESGGQFGVSVSGVPDADGDGLEEALVGAWHEDPGASPDGAGRAYFFSSIPSPEVWVDPPGPLAFGDQNINGGPTAAIVVTVSNIGSADLTFTGAEIALTGADAGDFVLSADSGENPLTPNATRTVQVAFDPSTVGLKSATLTITSNDADDATVEVALSGTGVDRQINVTGGPLAFGNQDLDDGPTAGMQVTITNTGVSDLSFTGSQVALTGIHPSQFSISADSGENPLTSGATRTVQVAFDPSSVGLKSASLTITSDDGIAPTVEVALSGTGIDQEIDVTGGPLAFGNQDIDDGPMAGIQVTITNTGTVDLTFTGSEVALTGMHPSEFAIAADSGENPLISGATRTVTVVFDPNSVGSKSTSLTITSDDTDEATANVSLSGTGIDQEIDVIRDPIELESPNEEVDGDFGWYLSGVPDVNGDGRGDVVVGARSDNPGGSPTDAGRAYVYDGATGALLHSLASPNEEVGGRFGQSVSGILDVNGDGNGDVVVGAYFEDPGGSPSGAGRAYIFDGSTGAVLHTLVSPNEEVDGNFGVSVTGVSDVNGDGHGDVVVGAYFEDPGGSPSEAGRAYIFDGSTGALLHTLVSPNEESAGWFGVWVGGVPDVNGDGRGDVVIGARFEDPGGSPPAAGRAYIFDGSTGALIHTLISPNEESGGQFGNRVSGVVDVNGDGRGDVVIGAWREDPGASPSEAGRAYIYDGSTGALIHTLVSPNEESGGELGIAVSGVSDINGDGRGDVVIGARSEDPGTSPSGAGRAYIYDGSSGALIRILVSANEESGGQFGVSVSEVSDADGDGLAEVLVGARFEDPGASPDGAGRAYLFSSNPSLIFGNQEIDDGATAGMQVTISNAGTADLSVISVSLSGADASEFSIISDSGENPLSPSEVRTVQVAFNPSSVGLKSATLTITSDDSDEATVEVALSGTGIDQEIEVAGGPLPFGNQEINAGTTAGMQVTITNTGTANLSFIGSEVALTGTDPGEFSITADSGENPLTPGATRTVSVAFDPSSIGSKNANLTITSDDTDEGTVNVSLSGTGFENTPTPTPTPSFTPTPTPTVTPTPAELPFNVELWSLYDSILD